MPENSAAVQQPDVAHGRERLHIVICTIYVVDLKMFFMVVSEADWGPRRYLVPVLFTQITAAYAPSLRPARRMQSEIF
jgi:hypothetical protein